MEATATPEEHTMSTTATATRTQKGTKTIVLVTYPDGTTGQFGGKIAERATHVAISHMHAPTAEDSDWYRNRPEAGKWGIHTKFGRPDLAAKGFAKIREQVADERYYTDAVELLTIA